MHPTVARPVYPDDMIRKSDVVTTLEIAARLKVQDQTVRVWRRRHRNFPQPFMYAARQGIWDFREVEAWYDGRAGLPRENRYSPPVDRLH